MRRTIKTSRLTFLLTGRFRIKILARNLYHVCNTVKCSFSVRILCIKRKVCKNVNSSGFIVAISEVWKLFCLHICIAIVLWWFYMYRSCNHGQQSSSKHSNFSQQINASAFHKRVYKTELDTTNNKL